MVKSAKRVATLITVLVGTSEGLLFSELERTLNLPKSSLHALLDTLVTTKMVSYDTETKRYCLGPLVWEAAMAFSHNLQLVPLAVPHLDRLHTRLGETMQMAILDGADIVYVAKLESQRPVQLASSVGSCLPAHTTGIGKALLASLPADRLKDLYRNNETLVALSSHTIRSVNASLHDLEETRARGYAIDAGECTPGLYCLATPILGIDHKALAAISVSVPESRYAREDRSYLASVLIEETHSLSRKLGVLNPSYWTSR